MKKLFIVLADTDDGRLYLNLEGDTERLHDGTPEEQLTLAEYWGMVLAHSCVKALETGTEFEAFKNMKVDSQVQ